MATPLNRKSIRNIGIYGLIRQAEVDDSLIPDGAVTEVQNFHFDRKGAATLRQGLTRIDTTVTTTDVYSCVGLFNSQSSALVAAFTGGGSSRIYWFDGSWLTGLTGGTASVPVRFVDFASYTIIMNFSVGASNSYTSMQVYPTRAESTSYFATTHSYINPQNMWGYNPRFGEVYKSRVYLAGDVRYPSRLFFSSVISSAGKITWTPATDFVDINPGDGEDCTGLKRYSLELLFFKPNYIYRYRTTGIDPDPLIRVGTRSQESIIEGKRGIYFHHDTGFYRYSGGYPEDVSRPISDFVSAIPFSQYANVTAWKDNDHIYFSVGNLTLAETYGNVSYKNVVLRYTESSEVWTVYSYARDIRRASPYVTNSSSSIAVGTDNGAVAQFNVGNTDLMEPIAYRLVTKWYDLEGIENRKMIQKLVSVCEKARGAHLMYQIDDDQSWKEIGEMTKYLNYWDPLDIRFHRIRFKVSGVSNSEALIFQEIIIHQGINEGFVK